MTVMTRGHAGLVPAPAVTRDRSQVSAGMYVVRIHRVHVLTPTARPHTHAHHANTAENEVPSDRPNGVHHGDMRHDVSRHPHPARSGRPPLHRQASVSCTRRGVSRTLDIMFIALPHVLLDVTREPTASTLRAHGARGARERLRGGWPASGASPQHTCEVAKASWRGWQPGAMCGSRAHNAPVLRQCCEGVAGREAPRGACGGCARSSRDYGERGSGRRRLRVGAVPAAMLLPLWWESCPVHVTDRTAVLGT